MKDRIILLIKSKNLTAAQFADEIGVQKSSISHIISGRNNASLDFVQKILYRYPEVNLDWIMFGKGPVFKGQESTVNTSSDADLSVNSPRFSPSVDLFSDLQPDKGTEFRKHDEIKIEAKQEENIPKAQEMTMPSRALSEEIKASSPVHELPIEDSEIKPDRLRHKNSTTKTLIKIVEFYSDNSFREFFPE